jgi:small subunit ribosomal protein S16
MLKIRLQRIGRINMPSYRLIVVEHTEGPKTGKFTDIVGTYNHRAKERKLDEAKIKHWLSVGAKPSDTVHNMFVSAGIIKGKKINVLPKFKAPETQETEAAVSPEAAQAQAQAQETPADEPKAEETPAQS